MFSLVRNADKTSKRILLEDMQLSYERGIGFYYLKFNSNERDHISVVVRDDIPRMKKFINDSFDKDLKHKRMKDNYKLVYAHSFEKMNLFGIGSVFIFNEKESGEDHGGERV